MTIVHNVILAILTLLAMSSGVTKIMLMQRDVEFFGQYGFTDPILIAYGVIQLAGGILMIVPKTRILGAVVVAATLVVSLVVLVMAGNFPVAIITLICIVLLVFIIRQSAYSEKAAAAADNE